MGVGGQGTPTSSRLLTPRPKPRVEGGMEAPSCALAECETAARSHLRVSAQGSACRLPLHSSNTPPHAELVPAQSCRGRRAWRGRRRRAGAVPPCSALPLEKLWEGKSGKQLGQASANLEVSVDPAPQGSAHAASLERLPIHVCPPPQGRRLLRQPESKGRQRGQQRTTAGRQGLLQKRPPVPHGAHLRLRLWGGDGPVGNVDSLFPASAVPVLVWFGRSEGTGGEREVVAPGSPQCDIGHICWAGWNWPKNGRYKPICLALGMEEEEESHILATNAFYLK